jgi:hypothetical protein
LGYYSKKKWRRATKQNFIQAKYDFIDEMMAFGGGINPAIVKPRSWMWVVALVGTSRYLAKRWARKRK